MADWDERYRRGEHAGSGPSRLLVRAVETLPPGRALDIACGAGRHAVFLAERGFTVTAVDSSRVAIEITERRARERGVRLDAHVADLERGEFVIAPEAYDLISIFYYLQRDLFPQIRAGIKPGARWLPQFMWLMKTRHHGSLIRRFRSSRENCARSFAGGRSSTTGRGSRMTMITSGERLSSLRAGRKTVTGNK